MSKNGILYLSLASILMAFAHWNHIRHPFCEEWLIYDFIFLIKDHGVKAFGHFFDYQSNHIIFTNRILYVIDYFFKLKGAFVLSLTIIFHILTFYILEQKLIKRERTLVERLLLISIFFSLYQFETFIHPHIVNYEIHNITALLSVVFVENLGLLTATILISGLNMLCWVALVPGVFISFYQKHMHWLKWLFMAGIFSSLALLYSDAPRQDPFHGKIYLDALNVLKYFFISASSLLPVQQFIDMKLTEGILFCALICWVYFKSSNNARLILMSGVCLNLVIAVGRASPNDPEFINATQSRYYTLWAPVYFVVVDYCLSHIQFGHKKLIYFAIMTVAFLSNLDGIKHNEDFVNRRKLGIECLARFRQSGIVDDNCYSKYLDFANRDEKPGRINHRVEPRLQYISRIMQRYEDGLK